MSLTALTDVGALPSSGDERSVFVLGGSAHWIRETVGALQEAGRHPILLNELPSRSLHGRYSCVRTDYHRLMELLYREGAHTAFYGMNRASFADLARHDAFRSCFPTGEVFVNDGSLARCFADFRERHGSTPFDCVICANDFAAVSLLTHLRQESGEAPSPSIAVHSNTEILSYYPEIRSLCVDHAALAAAAFEIVDCVEGNPSFIGVSITVDYLPLGEEEGRETRRTEPSYDEGDAFYEDAELCELMSIERLLAECDETDVRILQLLRRNSTEIGAGAFLSDTGVKYRIKRMKRLCGAESKSEMLALLERYGICFER